MSSAHTASACNDPSDDELQAMQHSMQQFIKHFIQQKKWDALMKQTREASNQSKVALLQVLTRFMEENEHIATCWTIPRHQQPPLHLRKVPSTTSKGLSQTTVNTAFASLTVEDIKQAWEQRKLQLQKVKTTKAGRPRKNQPQPIQNMRELLVLAVGKKIRDCMGKTTKHIIVVTEEAEHIDSLPEEKTGKLSKKVFEHESKLKQLRRERKLRAHPVPPEEVLTAAIEYYMEKFRLKCNLLKIQLKKQEVENQIGSFVYLADDHAAPVKKTKALPRLGAMSDTMVNVRKYLHRVNPETKTFRVSIVSEGQQKPCMIREKYSARNQAVPIKTIDTLLNELSKQDELMKGIPLEGDIETVLATLNNEQIAQWSQHFQPAYNKHKKEYQSKYAKRTIRFTVDKCPTERAKNCNPKPRTKKGKVDGKKRKRAEKEVDQYGFDLEAEPQTETGKKRRRFEEQIAQYQQYIRDNQAQQAPVFETPDLEGASLDQLLTDGEDQNDEEDDPEENDATTADDQ